MPRCLARVIVGLVLGLGLSLVPCRSLAEGPRVRTLILSDDAAPRQRGDIAALRTILEDTGRFEARVSEVPATIDSEALGGFDLVIDTGAGRASNSRLTSALAGFVQSGKGLVVTRNALVGSDAPAFWPLVPSSKANPSTAIVDVTIARPEHPIARGMSASIRVADAVLPPSTLGVQTGAEVIAQVNHAEGGSTPVVAVGPPSSGRVVSIGLGHDVSSMHDPVFRTILARSAEWAATGSVTLPPRAERKPAQGVKGLIITGGHDHEAAFYSLFNSQPELGALPIDTAATAFSKDIRDRCDVLILYDFTRELDDSRKQHLRDFVEAGKGVVVLHHALLDFQKWGWWSEEVAGGRYRLQREGTSPSSGVKNDQEIFVTPTGNHPVLRGIAPFHITDEAYKNLWMSDRVVPLLTTDNPTSDRNLAWIGPSKTSRVVSIQLGHGPSAFAHPAYRLLVKNAVLWAAGKLN